MTARIVMLVLAALLGLPSGAAEPPPAAAKKTFKTVTRTFSNSDQIDIVDHDAADPYPATIRVRGLKKGKIKDVNVILRGFVHDIPNDVDVLLVAPNGRQALLMSDVAGAGGAAILTLTLDDQAESALSSDGELTGGTFQPANFGGGDAFPAPAPQPNGNVALRVFDGGKPNGQWQLFIVDDFGGESGRFEGGWSLEITAKVKKKR